MTGSACLQSLIFILFNYPPVQNPLTISDGSIRCTAASQDGWSGIECRTTCEETNTCGDIYLERDDVEGGVFAEITYECLGETTQQIDTTFQYTSGADGVCEEGQISGRNFHVAQLGVLCSAENGQQEFDYGDRYFECGFGNFAFKHDGKYTCIAGQNCQGQPCEVAFEELTVEASSERFHECIESVSGIPVPEEPTDEEIRSPSVPGDYVATFEAKWQLSLDLTYCGAGFASKKITCVGGNISLTETLYDNIACSQISEDVLECSDTSDANFVNAFSGIIFVSIQHCKWTQVLA